MEGDTEPKIVPSAASTEGEEGTGGTGGDPAQEPSLSPLDHPASTPTLSQRDANVS